MKKFRLWIARVMLGDISYIHNVKFYGTVCLDVNARTSMYRVYINKGHTVRPVDAAFHFDYFEDNLSREK